MAIKIKKKIQRKSTKDEAFAKAAAEAATETDPLDEPDQFFKTADTSISWAQNNQQLVVIAVAALLLLAVGAVGFSSYSSSAKVKRSMVLTEAIDAMNAPVDAPAKDGDADPKSGDAKKLSFSSSDARFKSMDETAGKVIADYSGDEIAGPARLIKAQAASGMGKYAEAVTIYETWLKANANAPERAFILQALAVNQAASGKADAAISSLNDLKSLDDKAYGELASFLSAQIYESAGQKVKAKAGYSSFIEKYPDSARVGLAKLSLEFL